MMAVCLIPLDNSRDGSLLNPTGPLPIFHYRPASYAQKAKSKFSPIKNPRGRHIHNSLSNVVIHMPCVNIHHAGHYQLEMVFLQLDEGLPGSDRNG